MLAEETEADWLSGRYLHMKCQPEHLPEEKRTEGMMQGPCCFPWMSWAELCSFISGTLSLLCALLSCLIERGKKENIWMWLDWK